MDSDIGNFEKKGTRRKIVCFVCICRILRYSKLAKICVMRKMTHCLSRHAASLWHFSHALSRFLPA